MKASKRPRVLLIEDDTSLQRFVSLALSEFEIELLIEPSVEKGLFELARAPVALIMTDLMLPGRSGFDLIETLAAAPALRGAARLVVFSAGLDPQVRRRLERPEVWRLLSKPCSLAELEECVRSALAIDSGTQATATPKESGNSRAIAEHFGGNAALYVAFRAECIVQFSADQDAGERALITGDLTALRLLAHSLKSVLRILGSADLSALAHDLEIASERGDGTTATVLWGDLRKGLASLS